MPSNYPTPPFPAQKQPMPGATAGMDPRPDHGENSYKGSGKLQGFKAIITGGDSGIGRAVAIAYAREGADILIAYLNENEDAQEVKSLIEKEGRKVLLMAGDHRDRVIARQSSSARSMSLAVSISSSTTPHTKPLLGTSPTSVTKNGG